MTSASFPTTRRSVILALSGDDVPQRVRAFDRLVTLYWRPLYKYARVAWRKSREDAEDLTQAFFAAVLEKEAVAAYDDRRASFRTFLRLLFERSLSNDHKAGARLKRGGGVIPLDFAAAEVELERAQSSGLSPEAYFQQEWVRSVFSAAVETLRAELTAEGKQMIFTLFETYDLDETRVSYGELAARHGISETAVTNHLAAARRRFRSVVLDVLREVTVSEDEFRTEARALLGARV